MGYLLKRLGSFVITLYVIVTVTFALMKAVPGDPFTEEQALPEEVIEGLKKHYGLDRPWYEQYGKYLVSVVTLDFGPSFKYKNRRVNDIIKEGFPVSGLLGLEALCLAIAIGITLGCLAAMKQNQWQDRVAMLVAIIGISVPSFILATLLQYTLALKMNLFPVARWGTFQHTILPALALAALPTAFIARLTRANMIETLRQSYIRAARARGLSQKTIVFKHALRNAVLPVIAYLGQLTTNVLVGSFVVERIFGIPGLGQWLVNSISNRDYTVIMGITVFYSFILLTTSFLVDLSYGILDPRIRNQKIIRE